MHAAQKNFSLDIGPDSHDAPASPSLIRGGEK
jgi:hypothetical protein